MLQILPNYNLQHLNTLAVDAVADFFADIHSIDDLGQALKYAQTHQLPLLVLGGGSNIVLADDFPGLVLHIKLTGMEVVAEDDEFVWLKVGAGENWQRTVEHCLDFHYWGLENLSLIPGNVGAAPIQNIGAYGVELKDVFAELQAMEIKSGVLVSFDSDACQFGYRDSVFKHRLIDQYVITSVTFKLFKEPRYNLQYPALADALRAIPPEELSPHEVSSAVCKIRQSKLPSPGEIPNVGSFFKNPVVSVDTLERLQRSYPEMVAFAVDQDQVKLAAGWLIERAGLKGYSEGNVAVHQNQALVLTNPGRGNGREVIALADKIADKVLDLFGVALEREPRVYP